MLDLLIRRGAFFGAALLALVLIVVLLVAYQRVDDVMTEATTNCESKRSPAARAACEMGAARTSR